MQSVRYLNTILTFIALLLTLNLWTLWMGAPDLGLNTQVHAASGLPDPGHQRKQLVDLTKRVVQQNEKLLRLFETGKARVRLVAAKPQVN